MQATIYFLRFLCIVVCARRGLSSPVHFVGSLLYIHVPDIDQALLTSRRTEMILLLAGNVRDRLIAARAMID